MQYLSFCACLISLTITFYKSNHAATSDTCSFLRLNIFYCVCIYIFLFIFSSDGKHFGWFPIWDIENSASIHLVQVSLWGTRVQVFWIDTH
jgi:hypothetical protein